MDTRSQIALTPNFLPSDFGLATASPEIRRLAWNLEVAREQVPFRVVRAYRGRVDKTAVAVDLSSSDLSSVYHVLRLLMDAGRMDEGTVALFSDRVYYCPGKIQDVKGDGELYARDVRLKPGLDIRLIYESGAPLMDEIKKPTSSGRKALIGGAIISGAGVLILVGSLLFKRNKKEEESDEDSGEPEDSEEQEESDQN